MESFLNTLNIQIVKTGHNIGFGKNLLSLVEDNWDDFGFKTSYKMFYTSNEANIKFIGYVKIAYFGMEDNGSHIKFPPEFGKYGKYGKYGKLLYSLGQDKEYYENIFNLPDEIKKIIFKIFNDIVYDDSIFEKVKTEKALNVSLLRSVPIGTLKNQFKRIIQGKPALTQYGFEYVRNSQNEFSPNFNLRFDVIPGSKPSTNLHVLIGSNGVGKSKILQDLVIAASGSSNAQGSLHNVLMTDGEFIVPFVNVIHIAFSAFETNDFMSKVKINDWPKVYNVGLFGHTEKSIDEQFNNSFQTCKKEPKRQRWLNAIKYLRYSDPILNDYFEDNMLDKEIFTDNKLLETFKTMSSGHKISILTLTRIVELVEEQSLVLIDEPETHLHPPLLSAMTHAISDIMLDRNGVAIIATHSPIVLQEVPTSCVWRISRVGSDLRASRIASETYGESASRLTSDVFGLDVSKTGYHKDIEELLAETGSAQAVLETLNYQLGNEGIFLLNSLQKRDERRDV